MAHIAVYITGHGFGHATRMAAVLEATAARVPGLRLSLISTAPEWLFRLNLAAPFAFRSRALDVGVVQEDSIRLNARATLDAYAAVLEGQAAVIEEEVALLRQAGVDLVVADIPPAAFPVARRLAFPAWGSATSPGTGSMPHTFGTCRTVRRWSKRSGHAYGEADLFLRLPFHGPCDAFPVVRDIPMVARRARRPRADVRRRLGLSGDRPTVLLSFGGFEIRGIDFGQVARLEEYQFSDHPGSAQTRWERAGGRDGRLALRGSRGPGRCRHHQAGLRHRVGLSGQSRPGPVYRRGGSFAEYACLVAGLQRFGVSRFIENADLLAGAWREALEGLLGQRPGLGGLAGATAPRWPPRSSTACYRPPDELTGPTSGTRPCQDRIASIVRAGPQDGLAARRCQTAP